MSHSGTQDQQPRNAFAITQTTQTTIIVDQKSDPQLLDELVQLYLEVFNGVPGIQPKWTEQMARALLQQRLDRGAAILATRETEQEEGGGIKNRLVAAFFADLAPGKDGVRVSSFDVAVVKDKRGTKLGKRIIKQGYLHTQACSQRVFNQTPVSWHGQTYREHYFPRKDLWGRRYGFKETPLFSIAADAMLKPKSIQQSVYRVQATDRDEVIKLMSNPHCSPDDNKKWSIEAATALFDHAFAHNKELLRVVKVDGKIMGVLISDLTPGRGGSHLVDPVCFAYPAVRSHMRTLLIEVAKSADQLSRERFGAEVGLASLELPHWTQNKYIKREFYFSQRRDKMFVNVHNSARSFGNKINAREAHPT